MLKLSCPIKDKYVETSFYGWRINPFKKGNLLKKVWHSGLDMAATMGTRIYSAYNGVVVFAGERGGYGNCVIVYHPSLGKVWTLYGHLRDISAHVGENVTTESLVGFEGTTGMSTGPHLHFEVRVGVNGIWYAKDPKQYIERKS